MAIIENKVDLIAGQLLTSKLINDMVETILKNADDIMSNSQVSQEIKESVENFYNTLSTLKQNKIDNDLTTLSKVVVGAINELKVRIDEVIAAGGNITTTKQVFDTTFNMYQDKINEALFTVTQPFDIEEAFTERISATNDYEIEDGQAKVIELKGNTIKQIVKNNGYGGFTNTDGWISNSILGVENYKLKVTINNSFDYVELRNTGSMNSGKKLIFLKGLETNINYTQIEFQMSYIGGTFVSIFIPKDKLSLIFSVKETVKFYRILFRNVVSGEYFYLESINIIELTDEQSLLTVEELEQLIPNTLPYGITNSIINSYSTVGNNLLDINEINDYSKYISNAPINNYVKRVLKGFPNTTYYVTVNGNVKLSGVYWLISGSASNSGWVALSHATAGTLTTAMFTTNDSGNIYVQMLGGSQSAIDKILEETTIALSLVTYIPYEPYNKETITFPNIELSQWDRLYSPSGDMAVDLVKENNTSLFKVYEHNTFELYRQYDDTAVFLFRLSIDNWGQSVNSAKTLNLIQVIDFSLVENQNKENFSFSQFDRTIVYFQVLKSRLSSVSTTAFKELMVEWQEILLYETSERTQEQQTPLVSDNLPISNRGLELQGTNGVATTMNIKYLLDDKSQLLELSHDTANLKKKVAELENKKDYEMKTLRVTSIQSAGDDYVEFEDDVIFYHGVRLSSEPTTDDGAANKGYVDVQYSNGGAVKTNEYYINGDPIYTIYKVVANKALNSGWALLTDMKVSVSGQEMQPNMIMDMNVIEYNEDSVYSYPMHDTLTGNFFYNVQAYYDNSNTSNKGVRVYSESNRTSGDIHVIMKCTLTSV